ncbi:MAG: DUF559 domain-containing protein [Thermoleophilaceae bacterium]
MRDVAAFKGDIDPSEPPGRRIAALAARQYSVVSHPQLVGLGLGPDGIKHRVRTGFLHRLFVGVYAVGHAKVGRRGWQLAAVFACGPDAVLSHRDAADLSGLLKANNRAIDVTVPGRSRKSRPGIEVHAVRRLDPRDRVVRDDIPATTLARTLLDLAEVVPPRKLGYAIEEAERRQKLDVRAIEDLIARSPGRRGIKPLRAALAGFESEAIYVKSKLERRFLQACRDLGLPIPAVNVVVAGYEVDMHWPRQRLVVELDTRTYHATRRALESDRIRDADLQLAGHRVLRVTGRRFDGERAKVMRDVRLFLAAS